DNTSSGILDVTSHFFEFIPAEDYESADRRAVTLEELEVGREYFLMLTTSSGLWRYDIGDRVRVTGMFGEAPIVEFLSKAAHTSAGEEKKLPNPGVLAARGEFSTTTPPAVNFFVLAPGGGAPPFYLLYLGRCPANQADLLAEALDQALLRQNL